MLRYSHQYLIAVTVESDEPDPDKVPMREMMDGLKRRVCDIALDDNGREAFGHNDTDEI